MNPPNIVQSQLAPKELKVPSSSEGRFVVRWGLHAAILVVTIILIWQGATWWRLGCRAKIRAAMLEGRFDDAKTWIERSRWGDPQNANAFLDEARWHRKRGHIGESQATLEKASRFGVLARDRQLEELLIQAQIGDLKTAESSLMNVLRSGRGDEAEICDALVLGYLTTGQYLKAEVTLQSWQKDFPLDHRPFVLRGTLSSQMGRWKDAATAYQEALKLRPNDEESRFFLAEVLLTDQNAEGALPLLRHSVKVWPQRQEVRLSLARALISLGQFDEAIAITQELVKQQPQSTAAGLMLGQALLAAGRASEAVDVLRAVAERAPQNEAVRFQFGTALRLSGLGQEAEMHLAFAKAARLELQTVESLRLQAFKNAKDLDVRLRLASVLLKYEVEQEGLIWLRGVLAVDPSSHAAHRMLAEYYRRKAQEDPRWAAMADQHAALATKSQP